MFNVVSLNFPELLLYLENLFFIKHRSTSNFVKRANSKFPFIRDLRLGGTLVYRLKITPNYIYHNHFLRDKTEKYCGSEQCSLYSDLNLTNQTHLL